MWHNIGSDARAPGILIKSTKHPEGSSVWTVEHQYFEVLRRKNKRRSLPKVHKTYKYPTMDEKKTDLSERDQAFVDMDRIQTTYTDADDAVTWYKHYLLEDNVDYATTLCCNIIDVNKIRYFDDITVDCPICIKIFDRVRSEIDRR